VAGSGRRSEEWRYHAFVLRRSGNEQGYTVAWVRLGEIGPINDAIYPWYKIIHGTVASGTPEMVLRKNVWEKLEPHLAGCSTVVIIPDHLLDVMPWYALPGRTPGTCLIEDYAISTIGYGQQLYDLLTEPANNSGKLVLAGDVDYEQSPSPMPASATIAPPFTRSAPVFLTGRGASETALRQNMPGSRYIHLATHGFFADERSRSAAGHDVAGEQLFGGFEHPVTAPLARVTLRNLLILSGVVLAGARNVVASLWKVDDRATAALMRLFYHKLWQEGKPPIEALREAQLGIYRNPDAIPPLATTRGPDFDEVVKSIPKEKPRPEGKTAPPRLWAGVILSGPGQ